MAEDATGKKFPLIIYRRWGRMLRLPGLLIAIASGVVWWYAPEAEELARIDWVFIVTGVIGGMIFLYSLLVWRATYVQCLRNYVKIRTPFMSVAVSYGRILQVRPVEFHTQLTAADLKRTRRRILQPFLRHTAILFELKSMPVDEQRLRAWLPWFLFATEVTGFVLVVKDWMALSREVSVFSDRWVARRQARQEPRTSFFR